MRTRRTGARRALWVMRLWAVWVVARIWLSRHPDMVSLLLPCVMAVWVAARW